MNRMTTFGGTLVLLLACALSARAQVDTALIVGTVRDSTGAVVPGVEILITHLQTNRQHMAVTNDRGRYRSIPLPIGEYQVDAQLPGFKRSVRTGIVLEIEQHAVIDLVLEVGEVTEQVTVTGSAPLLQDGDASRGEVIDNQKIVDLPLNGREHRQLGLLVPGTNVTPGARFGGFTTGGMRADHNNHLLDGMDNNSNQHAGQGRTGQVISPSIDAIQEFKVLTNSYSAEYGRNVGGVVNAVLKSGSNEFHGSVFEFLRNDKLDAKNFFDDPDEPIPPFKRNQFGGTLGGPIVRNKTFFFFDYEGIRIRQSRTVLSTIPTERERRGIFPRRNQFSILPATIPRPTPASPFPTTSSPRTGWIPSGPGWLPFIPCPTGRGRSTTILFV